jgi:uncharacterized membrane-anchored protein
MRNAIRAALAVALLWAGAVSAQDDAKEQAQRSALINSLQFKTGTIALPSADASLQVQPGFRYLDKADSRKVLEQLWGNPPDDTVLGMLVPDNAALGTEHNWAVVLTYSDDGYVSDEDAAKMDYNQILADMKKDIHEANDDRKSEGYGTLELVGWAQPPSYDAATKRIYWAKELEFDGNPEHEVNYDIRVLGRGGYLSLNAVASASDLALVKDGMTRVLPMAQFDSGHQYADYKPGSDKLAAYGLAALVGGGLAAKAGLFAKIGVILLAAKKFILLGLLAIGAFIKKLFGGGKSDKGGTVT